MARDGRVIWRKAYGVADLQRQLPATPGTLFRIASMSKAITAVAMLRAVDAGLIALDADIRQYVPAFPAKSAVVTVRRLLTGTGGVRGYVGTEPLRNEHFPSIAASLSIFRDDSLVYRPGSSYLETPYGFTLLSLALEAVTHTSYETYVSQEVLRPANMTATRIDVAALTVPNRARPYTRDSLGNVRDADPIDVSYKVAAAGWLSTATDIARLGVALIDGTLLSTASYDALRAPVRLTDGTQLPLGMGIGLGTVDGRLPGTERTLWAAGIIQGGTSALLMDPDDRLAVALLLNVNGEVGPESLAFLSQVGAVAGSVAAHFRGVKGPRTPAEPAPDGHTLPPGARTIGSRSAYVQ
ncbi:MAG: beta-lactamase family protein [Gemmatimonadaceae bacterium]|nr:beta-lactamase family protein [Gemmatimonadaceae bacterium]